MDKQITRREAITGISTGLTALAITPAFGGPAHTHSPSAPDLEDPTTKSTPSF